MFKMTKNLLSKRTESVRILTATATTCWHL